MVNAVVSCSDNLACSVATKTLLVTKKMPKTEKAEVQMVVCPKADPNYNFCFN